MIPAVILQNNWLLSPTSAYCHTYIKAGSIQLLVLYCLHSSYQLLCKNVAVITHIKLAERTYAIITENKAINVLINKRNERATVKPLITAIYLENA